MSTELPRKLGLADSVSIVVGTIIGSGIFLVPNLVARQLHSVELILAVWIFSGVLSFFGALAYAEMGAMIPASGGQYAYLREAYGPMAAFLCGWTYFLVILSAAIAWLGVAFSTYLSYFIPMSPVASKLAAVGLIAVLTAVNCIGVRFGAAVQDVLTVLKVGGLATLVVAALLSPVNHLSPGGGGGFQASHFGAAMVACLLSFDGWVALGFVAGEVKNPRRTLPLGLAAGLGIAIAIYVIANLAFLKILTVGETAAAERVGAAVAARTMGQTGASIVALAILLSTAGAANGWLMTSPRVYFAQARDGLFFSRFARIHPRFETPAFSIFVQGAWAALLALIGAYETLASYAMLAAWLFYGVAALGVIVLRRKQPDRPRPYRMWGYPVTPVLFAAVAFGFVVNTLITDPRPSLSALALIAAGAPAYLIWRRGATVKQWTR